MMSGFQWLASYPKSGSTWLRLMLRSLSQGGAPVQFLVRRSFAPVAARRDNFEAWLDAQSEDLDDDETELLRPSLHQAEAQAATAPILRTVFDAWTLTRTGEPLFSPYLTLAAVYLVRDPRDVAVSLAHHFGLPVDGAIAFMARPDAALSTGRSIGTIQLRQRLMSWGAHVESWLTAPCAPLVLRYEDMLSDPSAELKRVSHHLGWQVDDGELNRAVEETRFDRLRRLEEVEGLGENAAAGGRFFRRGVAGGWRDTLSPAQVARIEREHGTVMARLGYR